jgi:transcriptional regulator with XRE-family HTH domain
MGVVPAISCPWDMDVRRRVGLNLQELRRTRGLSQEELADRAKIHQTYLSGVETGRRNPSIMVLQRIAVALGSDIEELTSKRGSGK